MAIVERRYVTDSERYRSSETVHPGKPDVWDGGPHAPTCLSRRT